MEGLIRTDRFDFPDRFFNNRSASERCLLENEIPGVRTRHFILKRGCRLAFEPDGRYIRILFLIMGGGVIVTGEQSFKAAEPAVFMPPLYGSFEIVSASERTEYLEISIEARNEDINALNGTTAGYPLFKPYSECRTYEEAIKSSKTVNRTIIEEGLVPRFCMGSVETWGPDEVGMHRHPMLEQLFFGLPGNSCSVEADGRIQHFGESVLLHIPPGSMHGVKVEEGCKLNYIWMDFFTTDDMSYIKENHKSSGEREEK